MTLSSFNLSFTQEVKMYLHEMTWTRIFIAEFLTIAQDGTNLIAVKK